MATLSVMDPAALATAYSEAKRARAVTNVSTVLDNTGAFDTKNNKFDNFTAQFTVDGADSGLKTYLASDKFLKDSDKALKIQSEYNATGDLEKAQKEHKEITGLVNKVAIEGSKMLTRASLLWGSCF